MTKLLSRNLLISTVVAVVLISVIGILFYSILSSHLISVFEEQIIQQSAFHGVSLNMLLDLRYAELTSLVITNDLSNWIETYSPHTKFQNPINNAISYNQKFLYLKDLRIIDKDLNVLFSTIDSEKGLVDTNKIQTDFTSVSHVHIKNDYYSNSPIVFYNIPIFNSNSELVGYLVASYDPVLFSEITRDFNDFITSEFYLVDFEKKLVTDSKFEDYALFDTEVDTTPVQKCLEDNMSYAGYYADYRGNMVFGSSQCVENSGLVLLHEVDRDELFLVLDFYKYLIIFSALVLIATLSITSLLYSHKIKSELVEFSHSLNNAFDGNYTAIPYPHRYDEFNSITNSFNLLLSKIKIKNKQLFNEKAIVEKNLESLKKRDIQKDNLTSMLSHELKTPLVPISGYVEMLLDDGLIGTLNSDQRDAVEKISKNTKNLEMLIHKILYSQRLDSGNIKYNLTDIDISKFMCEVYEENLSLMKQKNISFVNSTSTSSTLNSDPNMIREIFSNLLQNSVDFVPVDSGYIEINATDTQNRIMFFVKDNGNGIPKDKQSQLFKKFYQIDTSIRRKHGGTGLGLSICKKIIDDLNGKIWCESETGKGTTFFFELPNAV